METTPSAPHTPAGRDGFGRTVEMLVGRVVGDPDRHGEYLGEAFLACERAVRERPAEYRAAVHHGDVERFLLPFVRASLKQPSGARVQGGWLGVFVDPDGRPTEGESSGTDPKALETSRKALARAFSLAEAEGNAILLRNLRWYRERLEHRSYAAIAEHEGRPSATIRTGVARARKFLLRVVHELEEAQPAPLSGGAPPELEPLRQLWAKQDVERLRHELERTRERFGADPHWLNLWALIAHDAGERHEARRRYEHALVYADAPAVRARVLNNLGNLSEDEGDPDVARGFWLRAHQLLPTAPAPLLNLLADAAVHKNYASAQHHLERLGDLLRARRLRNEEEAYVLRRLDENPRLAWLRSTDAWRAGPARWLSRAKRAATRTGVALLFALASALGFTAAPAIAKAKASPVPAAAPTPLAPVTVSLAAPGSPTPIELARGGDSMGRSGGKKRGRPPRR